MPKRGNPTHKFHTRHDPNQRHVPPRLINLKEKELLETLAKADAGLDEIIS